MYRLKSIACTNVLGFMAGMGKKKVEIDLSEQLDHKVFVLAGDNGVGKSTLISLVHPTVWPSDGRRRFIIPDKEGIVIREYIGDDGTVVLTKCFYHPKKGGDGHSANCYFEVTKPGCEPAELNPNGNVKSYEALLQSYFGITKDFVSFASFSNQVASIVKMTDQERKDSVSTMTPNVHRFEVAFAIINEKYNNLRNLIRNVSQRISAMRDEDSLDADFKRLAKELRGYTEDRENEMKKLSKYQGQLKELTGGEDVDELISRYNHMVASLAGFDGEIDRVFRRLMKLYDKLGVEPAGEGTVNFDGIDRVQSNVMRYRTKIATSESLLTGYENRISQIRDELHRTEHEISETESMLYSIQTQNLEELKRTRENYVRQLNELQYTRVAKDYEGKSYDEVVNLSKSVSALIQMIQALQEEYGEVLTTYLSFNEEERNRMPSDMDRLTVAIETTSAKRDQIYRQLVEKEQYRTVLETLKQRPKNCTIDSCPFIANALRYKDVPAEIDELRRKFQDMSLELDGCNREKERMEATFAIGRDIMTLRNYMAGIMDGLHRYLGISSPEDILGSISDGSWVKLLDIMKLKNEAVVLSEKELYLQITNLRLPEIDHAIQMAEVYGTNRDLLSHQLERLEETRSGLLRELDENRMHVTVSETQLERNRTSLERWTEVQECIDTYRELIASQLETRTAVDEQDHRIQRINELRTQVSEKKEIIRELDELIRDRYPKQEQIKLDLDAIRRLKIEKAEVELDFATISVMRSIVGPGKGIRKELISIYMEEIKEITNQLLLNTFGGKLYLEDFIITDKEFIIPYVYNDSYGSDISYASGAQQSTIASSISLAIISKMLSNYGVLTYDEVDNALNPKNKTDFIATLIPRLDIVGISQCFLITQAVGFYEPFDVCVISFPGAELGSTSLDVVEV